MDERVPVPGEPGVTVSYADLLVREEEGEKEYRPEGARRRVSVAELLNGVETQEARTRRRQTDQRAIPYGAVMAGKHVFISYCHDNADEVARLRDDLVSAGESVWWDGDIEPGQDWKLEIRTAMKNAYAVVLCLSKETQARTTSGIYAEAADAVDAYRLYALGSIFLIPVRLSNCEIPPIEIDGTRVLDRLQHVDLFPDSNHADGLQRLIHAIQAAPKHP